MKSKPKSESIGMGISLFYVWWITGSYVTMPYTSVNKRILHTWSGCNHSRVIWGGHNHLSWVKSGGYDYYLPCDGWERWHGINQQRSTFNICKNLHTPYVQILLLGGGCTEATPHTSPLEHWLRLDLCKQLVNNQNLKCIMQRNTILYNFCTSKLVYKWCITVSLSYELVTYFLKFFQNNKSHVMTTHDSRTNFYCSSVTCSECWYIILRYAIVQ